MSLLDGLNEAMINPLFDSIMESDIDAEFDFETALEAAVDKQIELSDADIAAILDDENPDNVVADISSKDESVSKITDDAASGDLATLESMLDELLAYESDIPEMDDPAYDPESIESCKSTECFEEDEDDDFEDVPGVDDEEEEYEEDDDEYVSLDSILDTIFK